MTFSHFNRRLHLYLGLALLPWLFMYGASSIPFAHTPFFEQRDAAKGLPMWTLRSERTLDTAVPDDQQALRAWGASLLADAGIIASRASGASGASGGSSFGVYRQSPTQVNIYVYSFWKSTQLKYFIDQKKLTIEDRRFRWDQFLTGMHGRGGFEQEGILQTSWSVVVDVVCIAMLVWIATGLYMWWELPGHRRWGALAILAGTVSFFFFTMRL